MARVDAVVFDKTGTLTSAGIGTVAFQGAQLTPTEEQWVYSLVRHSTHPFSVRIRESIGQHTLAEAVRSFAEIPGCGIQGSIAGHEVRLGSAAWVAEANSSEQLEDGTGAARLPSLNDTAPTPGSEVHVAIDGIARGKYLLGSAVRPGMDQLLDKLSANYELALLSGDNEKEREHFRWLFGASAELHFNQSPLDKLAFIRRLQQAGKTVLMAGDGLNDAGALRQSDIGLAVVEEMGAFSPASDVIMFGRMVPLLSEVLRFSRRVMQVVRLSFFISSIYNIVGISIAARGLLSPVVCAILMPLSSVTVVAFACGVTKWMGRALAPRAKAMQPEPASVPFMASIPSEL